MHMKLPVDVRPAVLLVACFVALGGCKGEQKEDDNKAASKAEATAELESAEGEPATKDVESVAKHEQKTTPTAKAHMKEHLDQADKLREGVQKGELDTTRGAAAWLAEHEMTTRLSESWKPHVEMMQKAAHAARDAKDLESAAGAVGMLGESCASCHREVAGPKVEDAVAPTGDDLKAQMALHAWAAEQMWLGLIAPSDEAWVRGAEAMAKAELTPEELFTDQSPQPELLELEQTAQKLASESRAIKGTDANDKRRGELYASLLATCSECHSAVAKAR